MSVREPTRLPAEVRGLALVSLGNDLASEMVYPLLPTFVTSTLGGGPVALGALDGAADLAGSALRWWSGRRADRPDRRGWLIAAGYGLATVARPASALAATAWHVVLIRVIDRIGKGIRSPARDAMIADLVPAPGRGRGFGLQRAADHLGAVLGSLAAFALLQHGVTVRTVLGASLLPGLLVLITLLVVLTRAARREAEPGPAVSVEDPASGPVEGQVALLAGLAAVRLPETLLLLRLGELGVPLVAIPLAWAALHVVRSAASYPAGLAADRFGVRGATVLGAAAYGVAVGALAFPLTLAAALTAFLGFGLAAGVLEPAERAAVAAVRGSRRGSLFGSYQGMAGVGALLLGSGYGWIYQTIGAAGALGLAAAATASTATWWSLRRRSALA